MVQIRYLLLFLMLIPLAQAFNLDNTIAFNSSSSNTSLTFSVNITLDQAIIEDNSITLWNVSYNRSQIVVNNISTILNFSEENYNFDTDGLPAYASSSASNDIFILSNVTQNLTMNVDLNYTFCPVITSIDFTGQNNAIYTISSGFRLHEGTLNINLVDVGNGSNHLSLKCTSWPGGGGGGGGGAGIVTPTIPELPVQGQNATVPITSFDISSGLTNMTKLIGLDKLLGAPWYIYLISFSLLFMLLSLLYRRRNIISKKKKKIFALGDKDDEETRES